MSFDVMRVRLHLRGVRVTGVVVDTPAELVVGVVSVRKLSSCPFCGLSCQQVHDRRRQRQCMDLDREVGCWNCVDGRSDPCRASARCYPYFSLGWSGMGSTS